ncbi:MAG: sialidase [Gammaproteobacteria bacterium]
MTWLVLLFLLAIAGAPRAAGTHDVTAKDLTSLRFRFVGPDRGNRASAVVGVPGDPNVYYIGAASGGVWKSTDGGYKFKPIFDKQPVQSIGALAVDPNQHSVIWVGTGEPWVIRNGITPGDGVYKSSDGGRNWTHMGLDDTGLIARIVVNPHDSQNIFVCAMGTGTRPEQSRGVWRTDDAGKTWKHTLFVSGNTGCSGLAMDPQDPHILFAGMWQWMIRPWAMTSGGPSSGVYVSHDGGNTWKQIKDHGLPDAPLGKIDVAIAPSNPDRVYALIETAQQGSLWRSDDGGKHWNVENYSRLLTERAGYCVRLAVSPTDEDKIFVASNGFYVSGDGGKTFQEKHWGGDNHDIWFDPSNSNRIMISDDGGVEISTTGGENWHHVTLPIGQMYHVAVDNQVPYWVYTNMQDDDAERGPAYPDSTPLLGGIGELNAGWQEPLGGCESGFTYPDPTDADIIWSTCYGNEITRLDTKVGYPRAVSPWPLHSLDSPPEDLKYRCHWTPPLAIDPFDHNTVYYGCQVIFKTTNGGQSWSVISPDLSTHNPKYLVPSGGIPDKGKIRRQDNLGQFYGELVFAIAPSSVQKGLIWAGTNDGQIWLTRDAGGHWTNVTKNIPNLPPWGTVSRIEPSHFDAGTAYIAVDLALMGDSKPYIYETTNFGQSWKLIVHGIPVSPTSNVSSVAQDPYNKNLLFAGTGNALYVSFDAGGNWMPLQAGLPHAPVSWETVQKPFHDLVVSTYGRGIYVLEDISPLERLANSGATAPVRVFKSRPAYRFFNGAHAFIAFWLDSVPKVKETTNSKDDEENEKKLKEEKATAGIKVAILDADGKVVRELKLVADEKKPGLNPTYKEGHWAHDPDAQVHTGINRVYWDLRYAPPKLIMLRTTPTTNPHVWDALRFMGKDSRPITHWGIKEAEVGPLVAPGTYTARVTVAGKTYDQTFKVLASPRSPETPAQTEARVKLLLHIQGDISSVTAMVNQAEWLRKQLQTVEAMLKADKKSAHSKTLQAIKDMDKKIQDLENKLLSPALANSDEKSYLAHYGLYLHLIWLNGELGTGAGDVYGDPGYPPTDATIQVLQLLDQRLGDARAQYQTLMQSDLPQFNQTLVRENIFPLVGGAGESDGKSSPP